MIYRITEHMISVIENTLSQGKRIELIPTKTGIKIICVERHEAKNMTRKQSDVMPRSG